MLALLTVLTRSVHLLGISSAQHHTSGESASGRNCTNTALHSKAKAQGGAINRRLGLYFLLDAQQREGSGEEEGREEDIHRIATPGS